jgi:hypothetical protein
MDKEKKNLLVFGYGLGGIAAIFGIAGFLKHGAQPVQAVFLLCCIIFTSVTALNWQALRPGYKGWMKVAHVIGAVVTTIILATVFFAVFTPVAAALKVMGRDHLGRRKADRAAKSYWQNRPAVAREKQRYLQQF